MVSSSELNPETAIGAELNSPYAHWVELYTLDGSPRLVPPEDVEKALAEGMVTQRYDLDAALAEWDVAMKAALDAVPKAIAEWIASGYQRDEDSLIVSHAFNACRDAGATLMFAAGALIPTEGHIRSLAALPTGPVEVMGPNGTETRNVDPPLQAQREKHAAAIANLTGAAQ